jgi:hypothetical protein
MVHVAKQHRRQTTQKYIHGGQKGRRATNSEQQHSHRHTRPRAAQWGSNRKKFCQYLLLELLRRRRCEKHTTDECVQSRDIGQSKSNKSFNRGATIWTAANETTRSSRFAQWAHSSALQECRRQRLTGRHDHDEVIVVAASRRLHLLHLHHHRCEQTGATRSVSGKRKNKGSATGKT